MMNENNKQLCVLCQNCQSSNNEGSASETSESCVSKCQQWLESCSLNDETRSESSCGLSSSIFERADTADGDFYQNGIIYDRGVLALSDTSGKIEYYEAPSNPNQNVIIKDCKNVLMGSLTKVYGTVNIIKNESNTVNNMVTNNIFLNGIAEMVPTKKVNVVPRRNWVAQPPIDPPVALASPAKLVIISHTATEHALTQAENVLLVRNIQTFHIESRRWSDIAYNYLVGCDGLTYQGRGWGVIGAHTKGYNDIAVGISFIGCFLRTLPSESALHQAKALIEWGVEVGAIDKDYVLVGHCQCCPTESPGRRLFEEIQTWDHWRSTVPI
ncbi:peptidoglycan-recognition protein LE-like isoform X2 [Photinus pyralis]|uniref:Peptidoglycan recognition protein family domain-containing protein n=1 Tax=Photinus pyralis TaxID=7054 RepID=A0A1Y1JYH4_PHOPY|nr:peptidoglycan-recognition protein LE-like isoform X2 [Photinus pyralis]